MKKHQRRVSLGATGSRSRQRWRACSYRTLWRSLLRFCPYAPVFVCSFAVSFIDSMACIEWQQVATQGASVFCSTEAEDGVLYGWSRFVHRVGFDAVAQGAPLLTCSGAVHAVAAGGGRIFALVAVPELTTGIALRAYGASDGALEWEVPYPTQHMRLVVDARAGFVYGAGGFFLQGQPHVCALATPLDGSTAPDGSFARTLVAPTTKSVPRERVPWRFGRPGFALDDIGRRLVIADHSNPQQLLLFSGETGQYMRTYRFACAREGEHRVDIRDMTVLHGASDDGLYLAFSDGSVDGVWAVAIPACGHEALQPVLLAPLSVRWGGLLCTASGDLVVMSENGAELSVISASDLTAEVRPFRAPSEDLAVLKRTSQSAPTQFARAEIMNTSVVSAGTSDASFCGAQEDAAMDTSCEMDRVQVCPPGWLSTLTDAYPASACSHCGAPKAFSGFLATACPLAHDGLKGPCTHVTCLPFCSTTCYKACGKALRASSVIPGCAAWISRQPTAAQFAAGLDVEAVCKIATDALLERTTFTHLQCAAAACGLWETEAWRELSGSKFLACNGCKLVSYYSKACQRADWKSGRHRAICQARSAPKKALGSSDSDVQPDNYGDVDSDTQSLAIEASASSVDASEVAQRGVAVSDSFTSKKRAFQRDAKTAAAATEQEAAVLSEVRQQTQKLLETDVYALYDDYCQRPSCRILRVPRSASSASSSSASRPAEKPQKLQGEWRDEVTTETSSSPSAASSTSASTLASSASHATRSSAATDAGEVHATEISYIYHNLYLSDWVSSVDMKALKKERITRVICICEKTKLESLLTAYPTQDNARDLWLDAAAATRVAKSTRQTRAECVHAAYAAHGIAHHIFAYATKISLLLQQTAQVIKAHLAQPDPGGILVHCDAELGDAAAIIIHYLFHLNDSVCGGALVKQVLAFVNQRRAIRLRLEFSVALDGAEKDISLARKSHPAGCGERVSCPT